MINKVFNWICGSFFRSLGRIIAYLLIGGLLGFILYKNGFTVDKLLLIDKVYASTSWSVNQSRIVTDFNGSYSYTSWSNQSSAYTPTDPVVGLQYRLKVSGGAIADNSYVFRVAYKPTPDTLYSTSPVLVDNNGDPRSDYTCTSFNYNTSDGYYKSTCTFTPQTNMSISDYLYVRIWFEGGGSYVSSLAIGLSSYDLRQGTGSIITDMGNDIIDTIDNNFNTLCPNLINFNNGNLKSVTATSDDFFEITYDGLYLSTGKTYYISWKSNKSAGSSGDTAELHLLQEWGYDHTVDINTKTKTFTVNSNGNYYLRLDCNKSGSTCTFYDIMISEQNVPYCQYGTTTNKLDEQTNAINGIDDTLNDDNTSEANSEFADFFNNFNNNTHGLTGIITAPLNAIQSLTSSSCSALTLPLPFVNSNLTLPCMRPIYNNYFGNFMTLYDAITLGIVSYWVMVKIFALVKDFKNPEHDEVEVMDL